MALSKKVKPTAAAKDITSKPKIKSKAEVKAAVKVEPEIAEGSLTSADFSFRTVNSTYKLLETISDENGTAGRQYSISLRLLAADLYLWAKLFREIEVDGATYETTSTAGDKVTKVNPAMEVMDKAFKRVTVGLKAHGFDPASAASVSKTESDGKSQLAEAFAKLLGGGDLEDDFK
ncbi:MAG TPA: hypothetical protein EYN67_14375 [Flavobacteriales bacterium]|nr:hypothetical protein [Flavobacteriales bacterium]